MQVSDNRILLLFVTPILSQFNISSFAVIHKTIYSLQDHLPFTFLCLFNTINNMCHFTSVFWTPKWGHIQEFDKALVGQYKQNSWFDRSRDTNDGCLPVLILMEDGILPLSTLKFAEPHHVLKNLVK